MRNHSLMDRTQDSDSCDVGSIPAGCIATNGENMKDNFFTKMISFCRRHYRVCLAALLFVILVVAVVMGIVTNIRKKNAEQAADPMSGVEGKFEVNEHEDINALINSYYVAYASGDTATLQSIADPFSDAELSYIEFYSDYIEEFRDIVCYTKRGHDDTAYLVSVTLAVKFKEADTPAPGLEFFYVRAKDDGSFYIDNIYSTFNTANNEFAQDVTVKNLIASYQSADDVLALQIQVQNAYAAALEADSTLKELATVSIQNGISEWALEYVAKVEEARIVAEEEAKAAEAEAKRLEEEAEAKRLEEEAKAAEAAEEANAFMIEITDKVNVREKPDSNSSKLGQVTRGTKLKCYSQEDGWSKVDYSGKRAYISSDYVKKIDESVPEPSAADDNNDTQATSGIAKGETIVLDKTVNIRSDKSETASKVAVAYVGDKIKVEEADSEGWTKVTYNKKTGYVKTELLTAE